jgi:hypothetical protein
MVYHLGYARERDLLVQEGGHLAPGKQIFV